MKETTLAKTKQRAKSKGISSTKSQTGLDVVSTASIGVMGAVSAFIGSWALLCFAAALVNAGPVELVKSFFSAITGM